MPIPAAAVPIITSLIGLGGTLIGAGASARGSRKNRKAQVEQNERDRAQAQFMYEYERDDKIKQWERENAYNHPAQQMQRLKEAGLNPNLVYGSGATATGGSIEGTSFRSFEQPAPVMDYGHLSMIPQGINNAIGSYYDAKMFQLETNKANTAMATQLTQQALNDAKAAETLEKIRGYKFDTDLKYEVRDSLVDSYKLKNELLRSQFSKNIAETKLLDEKSKQVAQDIILEKGRYELEKAKTGKELLRIAADIALKEAQTKAIESNTELNADRKRVMEEQATMLAQLAEKLRVEAEIMPFNSGVSAGKTILDGLLGKEWLPGSSSSKTSTPSKGKTAPKKQWAPPRR